MDHTDEMWDRVMTINLRGVFQACQVFGKHMMDHGGGAIVNMGSVTSHLPLSRVFAYSASKAGVLNLTRNVAQEFATKGVRVNCICPGSVDTPMLKQEMEELGGVEKLRPLFEAKHPLGRICTPEEVAKAALFLASDDSAFVTGSSLVIDGGITAG